MKRMLALLLGLWLMCPAALAETYAVDIYGTEESQGYSLLIRDDGTLLTPTETYASVYEITPDGTPEGEGLYSVAKYDLGLEYTPELADEILYDTTYNTVALMDDSGRLLTGFDYDWLDYVNGYVMFTLPGDTPAVGIMDTRGNVMIEPDYAMVKPIGDGRWIAMMNSEDDILVHRVDTGDGDYYEETSYPIAIIEADGSVRPLGLHSSDRYFGLDAQGGPVLWSVDEYDGQTVFLGSDGALLFGRSFQYADPFVGNYATVQENGRYGVIDRTGAYVLAPEYDYINMEANKPCVASRGTAFAAFDPDTMAPLLEMDLAPAADVTVVPISRDLLGVIADEKSWLYSASGELLMDVPEGVDVQMYGYTGDAITRLVAETGVWPDEVCRLIDLRGNPVSSDFRMINAGAWRDGHGRFIIADFDVYEDAEGDRVIDWNSYRYGLIDENGEALLEPVYDELRVLSFDRIWAETGDRRGLIDDQGNWLFALSNYETLMD